MKGIVLLNGLPYAGKIDAGGAYVVCCDGAYDWAAGKVRIDENIGDFDSVSGVPNPPPTRIYPSEKDFTDGEIALFRLFELGVDMIEIYGGGGGREDHFLGNLHLLYLAKKHGAAAVMITENSEIFCAEGKIPLGKYLNKTVSVLPFGGPLHINDFKGLKYGYPPAISYGECRGISNIVEEERAYIDVQGEALIIANRGKV